MRAADTTCDQIGLFDQPAQARRSHNGLTIEKWLYDRLSAGTPTLEHQVWPEMVAVHLMRQDYLSAADKGGSDDKSFETEFGIALRKLIPLSKKLRTIRSRGRCMFYRLPPLVDARKHFSRNATTTPGALSWR